MLKKKTFALRGTATACLALMATMGHGQSTPDAGTLLRESQRQAPALPALPPLQAPKLLQDTGLKVKVVRFEISGNTRVDSAVLQVAIADRLGRELNFAQLQDAADRLAAVYRERGLHATALLPEQALGQGVVRIVIVEGRFGQLKLDTTGLDGRALPLDLVQRMLAQGQQPGQVLATDALEQATLIANEVPGVRVSSVLQAGEKPGETDVVAKVDARPLVGLSFTLDNHDARATGSEKFGLAGSLGGPLGLGEEFQLAANATQGKNYVRLAAAAPLNALGTRGGLNVSQMRYALIGEFAALDAKGSADTAGATLNHPLHRSAKANLYTSLTGDHKKLVNDSLLGELSNKTVTTLTLGVNGDALDELGAGGATVGGLQLTVGKLDLSGNAADLAGDQAGPQRNGKFGKVSANLGRLQRVNSALNLWASASGQVALKNLDSGEKFSLGGAGGVRAYPAIEGSGDHGWLATVEARFRFSDQAGLTLFYDHGGVTRDKKPYAGSATPNSYQLKGLGAGIELQLPKGVQLRAALAHPIGANSAAGPNGNNGDGTARGPQLWLQATLPLSF